MTTTIKPELRFVKSFEPVKVESNGLTYRVGKLSYLGTESWPGVLTGIRRYLKNELDFSEETADDAPPEVVGAANVLLKDRTLVILTCDYTLGLTPADLLEWPEEFFEESYQAAIQLNPKLNWSAPKKGQAQPETHDKDGKPKSVEETPKN